MLVFRQVELPSFWFLAVVSCCSSDSTGSEYRSLYQLLGSVYASFVRQNGPLRNSLTSGHADAVRARLMKRCQLFFEWFLPHVVAETGISAAT